ncbi:peptidoglycan-binding domain-containing protein [Marivivens niveibacter]|nr:peptidoglycan-binding domain-containing protein [Marivivens niveibacter]
MQRQIISVTLWGVMLTACTTGYDVPYSNPPEFIAADIERDFYGNCYGRDVTPALTNTETNQLQTGPEIVGADGTVIQQATYQTVTNQTILRERREVLFETVCPDQMTPEFIASLQRALATRGYYQARITGVLDAHTKSAVRLYQQQQTNIDSPLLAIQTARILGLVALTPEQLGIIE